jgi:hypothetical protein
MTWLETDTKMAPNSTIIQLYYGENKLIFNEMMMMMMMMMM